MTTIYLIRHAEAEGNLYRRLHGHYDSMITPNGLRQIEALRRRFDTIQIHACYSSDLTRACQTAQAICKSKRLRLIREPAFREINCGDWEDQSFGTLEHIDPQRMYQFNHDMWKWQVPNSETFSQASARFIKALRQIAADRDGQTIVIVTHGAVLRAVQTELFFTRDAIHRSGHCDNTGVTKLNYDGKFHLDYLNDNSHLDDAISTLARQTWWRQPDSSKSQDHNLWFQNAQDNGALYLDVRQQNWRQRCGILPWADESKVTQQMQQLISLSSQVLYYAMLGQTLVGTLLLDPDPTLDYGIIHYLGVLPERQNMGFAVQLLGQAVSHYRRLGKAKLRVLISSGDYAAVHFFENNGFHPRKQGSGGRWYEQNITVQRSETTRRSING